MHPRLKTLATTVLVVALVAAAAVSFKTATNYKRQVNALQVSLDAQTVKLDKRDTELGVARKALSNVEGATAAAGRTCTAQQDQWKQTVDAFAKQAGACETLRHKLNVPGYTS